MREIKKFKIKDIFDNIEQGSRLPKRDQIDGDLPFVMSGFEQHGISKLISNDVKVFPKNSITMDVFRNVFYRSYNFGASDDVAVYYNEDPEKYTVNQTLFIKTAYEKAIGSETGFGNKLRGSETYDIEILLPVNQEGNIDLEYMDNTISILLLEKLNSISEDIRDVINTQRDLLNIDIINMSVDMKEYKVEDLFTVNPTKTYPQYSDDYILRRQGETPFITNSEENNGVRGYTSLRPNNPGNVITYSDTTTENAMFYQSRPFIGRSHVQLIKLKNSHDETMTENIALYLISAIKKSVTGLYDYGSKFNRDNLLSKKILLPVDQSGDIFYEYMESYIAKQKIDTLHTVRAKLDSIYPQHILN